MISRLRGPARPMHPVAWWLWALAVAAAAAQTTNLALLALLAVAVGRVVVARKPVMGLPGGFSMFLRLALLVVLVRVVLQVLLVGSTGATVLFRLPRLPLPGWMAGVGLGGAVTLEATLAALSDGCRLAVMLICFGAANALATPARLLRQLPRGLQAFGVATTVALSAAPALAAAFARVRRARRLRGVPIGGPRGAVTIVAPVLEEALDRALAMAAALDARGFGRRTAVSRRRQRVAGPALLVGPVASVAGAFLLVGSQPVAGFGALLGPVLLGSGIATGLVGLRLAGAGVITTRYRPEPWTWPEWTTVLAGLASAFLVSVAVPIRVAQPDPWLLQGPVLSGTAVLAVLLALLPALAAPQVPGITAPTERAEPSERAEPTERAGQTEPIGPVALGGGSGERP